MQKQKYIFTKEDLEEVVDISNSGKNKDGKTFVRLYTEDIRKLSKRLSKPELILFLDLLDYLSWTDNTLKNGYGKSVHYMTISEIAELENLQVSNCTLFLNGLVGKGVLAKFSIDDGSKKKGRKENHYAVNPNIVSRGMVIPVNIMKMFEDFKW